MMRNDGKTVGGAIYMRIEREPYRCRCFCVCVAQIQETQQAAFR